MIVFGEFKFDPKQQILTQNAVPVPLTQKQARLLALFVNEPERVFSKEDILDQVWEGRAVSEQVVFQNISKLRNLISSDAIKTYSKRGYQWQLPLEQSSTQASRDLRAPEISARPALVHNINKRLFLSGAVVLFAAVLLIVWQSASTQTPPIAPSARSAVHFLPFGARYSGPLEDALVSVNGVMTESFQTANQPAAPISARQFMNSSFMKRQSIELEHNALLVSGILRRINNDYFLTYRLQGPHRSFESYIIAPTPEALAHNTIEQINRISGSKYFELANDAAVTAELALLHEQFPGDPAILSYLIERHLDETNYDIAGAFIDKLELIAEQQTLDVHATAALWLRGRRAIALLDWESAETYLTQANVAAEEARLPFVQSEILKTISEIAFNQRNFEAVKRHLLQAASLSRIAGEPVMEIRAYTLLSIMASKFGFKEERIEYLGHAKSLLADGKFDDSHYMLIHYHFALFEEDPTKREAWYREVLARSITPENAWVFESAADQLVDLLIEEKRWPEALAIAEQVSVPAIEHKLKAVIYLAQGLVNEAILAAQQAFTLARVNGDRWVGLPVALMLYENSLQAGDSAKASEYRQYLISARTGRWKNWRTAKLASLGID